MDHKRVRLDLERTGGFGGRTVRVAVDSALLPVDEARNLIALVEQVDFDALQARGVRPEPTPPDAFQYKLDVEQGGRQWRLRFTDSDVTDELSLLLAELVSFARRSPRRPDVT